MKKYILACVMPVLLFPIVSEAAFIMPRATLIIHAETSGPDEVFNFNFRDANIVSHVSQNFNISTQNASGSYTLDVYFPDANGYYLNHYLPLGWKVNGKRCNVGPEGNSFASIDDGLRINIKAFTTMECYFNFSPQNLKDPVLVIPGTLATDIYKGNDLLWLDILRLVQTDDDRFMDPLAYKDDGTPLDTSLTLGQVLEKPHDSYDYSKALIDEFAQQGYKKNEDLFFFPYDWRQDISQNAVGPLKQKIDQLASVSPTGKISVIAHSQGGLIIKRLLFEMPQYEQKINKLILVGVPNLGSPKSFKVLQEGDQLGIKYLKILGLDPEEIKRIAKNMPSVYEMLPSSEYFKHYDGYWGVVKNYFISTGEPIIFNYETTKEKLKDAGYNAGLLDKNDIFHSIGFDQFDLSSSTIDTYNILGCQSPTFGGVIEKNFAKDKIIWLPGDETVPLKSASNVIGVKNFYSLGAIHSIMLTQEGSRQKIVNIITGSSLPEPGITSNITDCHFNGQMVSLHSPVDLHIYDQLGRHTGPISDGRFDFQIPNVGYEIIGHEKFAFLPEGNNYNLKLTATAAGNFDFYDSNVFEGKIVDTAFYEQVPVATSSQLFVSLESVGPLLRMDSNGDNQEDYVIPPSSLITANQSQDLLPPVSTSTLAGTMGAPGMYRSKIQITLKAEDVVVPGYEAETSGLLNLKFRLDNASSAPYSTYTGPISLESEGKHTLEFYATDKAGNNEAPQTLTFTIDKTAPELVMQFDQNLKDLSFTAKDNLSLVEKISLADQDNTITATDEAGNKTVLTLKDKNRKNLMKAEIKSLSYNGQSQDISRNKLNFAWAFDKKKNLELLSQSVQSKKNFNILAIFDGKKTSLVGRDSSGIIFKTLKGLVLLKISTNQGDLVWSY